MLTFFRDPEALVTFVIGPDEKKFLVHKEFACHYSPVLKAAFNSNFIEGQTKTYRLDDTTEGAFQLFVQGLYSQRLEIPLLQDENMKHTNTEAANGGWESLCRLWVLTDKLEMPRLQNLAIESIYKFGEETNEAPTRQLHFIYDNTSAGSPLRRYMVDLCHYELESTGFIDDPEMFPHAFLIDLAVSATLEAERYGYEIEDYMVKVGDDQ